MSRFHIAVAAVSLCLIGGSALAFPPITDPNKDEAKCEQNAQKTIAKFVKGKMKCISKCFKAARKLGGPYTPCLPPYDLDPKTDACIHDSLRGAEAKAGARIVKKCVKDCPECYDAQSPAICADGTATNPFVVLSELAIDTNVPEYIYCTEALFGATPTKDAAKCEDAVAKNFVKFFRVATKCYQKCQKNELKGKIAPGSCTPYPPSDPATESCIVKAAEKAAAGIDRRCKTLPTCYPSTIHGTDWITLYLPLVNSLGPYLVCGA